MSLVEAPDSTTRDFHSAAWLRFQALTAAADTLLAASDDAHLACTAVAALRLKAFHTVRTLGAHEPVLLTACVAATFC